MRNVFGFGLLCVLFSTLAFSAVPRKVSYQGVLSYTVTSSRGSSQKSVKAGNYSVRFQFFDAATGGSAGASDEQTVSVGKAGAYSVTIGADGTDEGDLDMDVFNSLTWLQVTILSGPDSKISYPYSVLTRVQLTTVPYAAQVSSSADLSVNSFYASSDVPSVVHGIATGINGTAVTGESDNGTNAWGVYGRSNEGRGVFGASATGSGVYGKGTGSEGVGVYAHSDMAAAVKARTDGSFAPAVYAIHTQTGNVAQLATIGYAMITLGDVSVNGTLSKSAGSFKIDHPLDPSGKYLSHSFVESPDMMNVYNGNVVLDGSGEASVALPQWFGSLNKEFRYQLTAIGSPGPNLYIAEKISNNRFRIAGGAPNAEVSWQVTGIRQDAYANAHRIQVEELKTGKETGTYIHPELFGAPPEKSTFRTNHPETSENPHETSVTKPRSDRK